MTEKVEMNMGENSPQHVAHKLTEMILFSLEKKSRESISRKDYLDTYAECLHAANGFRQIPKS